MEKENRFSIGDISQYLNIILWSMIISIIALISFQRSNFSFIIFRTIN
ncbi:hypothetical protein TEHAL1_10300 [Tetragenococcus halophilus]|nr:hypothetical protein WJ7_23570 [Tetragenococcus halophilus]GMG60689.1 hypothetical protein TEHAB4_04360 [Tetragenococcus halophilus]GMG63557.1 hypothetical protein TEHAL1_10300 [Tetragenococcus halophilus]GMG66855.1 hypothetical protein TEHIT2_20460 [Tetragenococcus halophilus]GMG67957.1 hypothetical protein TEHMS4_08920 [Tetragenococcus halophilus]